MMNNKTRKLLFIRSKNRMIREGFKHPKWILKNHKWPTLWINVKQDLLEESWRCDMRK